MRLRHTHTETHTKAQQQLQQRETKRQPHSTRHTGLCSLPHTAPQSTHAAPIKVILTVTRHDTTIDTLTLMVSTLHHSTHVTAHSTLTPYAHLSLDLSIITALSHCSATDSLASHLLQSHGTTLLSPPPIASYSHSKHPLQLSTFYHPILPLHPLPPFISTVGLSRHSPSSFLRHGLCDDP